MRLFLAYIKSPKEAAPTQHTHSHHICSFRRRFIDVKLVKCDLNPLRRMRVVGWHERMCTHDVPAQPTNQPTNQPTVTATRDAGKVILELSYVIAPFRFDRNEFLILLQYGSAYYLQVCHMVHRAHRHQHRRAQNTSGSTSSTEAPLGHKTLVFERFFVNSILEPALLASGLDAASTAL
jgi:hypothetical protein